MPTNANTFNSRVTSEALEAKFRQVFPSQGGAELPQDLFASGVITPVVDFSRVAEGSVLSENLQTAWGFATDFDQITGAGTTNIIVTPGFYKIDWWYQIAINNANTLVLQIWDGAVGKNIWRADSGIGAVNAGEFADETSQVVFLRSGDLLRCVTSGTTYTWNIWHRQIADVYGNLVNPLGFSFT